MFFWGNKFSIFSSLRFFNFVDSIINIFKDSKIFPELRNTLDWMIASRSFEFVNYHCFIASQFFCQCQDFFFKEKEECWASNLVCCCNRVFQKSDSSTRNLELGLSDWDSHSETLRIALRSCNFERRLSNSDSRIRNLDLDLFKSTSRTRILKWDPRTSSLKFEILNLSSRSRILGFGVLDSNSQTETFVLKILHSSFWTWILAFGLAE